MCRYMEITRYLEKKTFDLKKNFLRCLHFNITSYCKLLPRVLFFILYTGIMIWPDKPKKNLGKRESE